MVLATAKRRRWWRWPAYALLGIVTLAAGLLLSLRTPFVREQIRGQVNAALADVFQGRVRIQRIGKVGLGGIRGVDATVFDPVGTSVIRLWGLSVSASLLGLAWQLVTHGAAPELSIDTVRVEHADVKLREDEDAGVTLATTFLPRGPSAPEPSTGAGPRLRIAHLRIGSAWIHGNIAGGPPLDLELRELEASLSQSPVDGVQLDVASAQLVTRAMPLGLNPRGRLNAAIDVPAGDASLLRLELSLEGQAAESPLSLEGSWVGDDVHARVDLWRVPAELINRQVEGLALDGEDTLNAEVDGALPQLDFAAELDSTAAHVALTGYAMVSGGAELSATAVASDIDAARIVAGAPSTQLDLEARAFLLEKDNGHYSAAYRLDVDAGRADAQSTPPMWLSGRAELDNEEGVQARGKLGADESGVSLRGSYDVSLPSEREGLVSVDLDAELDDPARLSALGLHVAGSASVSGQLRPWAGDVSANAAVNLREVARGSLQAHSLQADATLSGSLDAPRVQATTKMEALSGHAQARLDYGPGDEQLALIVAGVDLGQLASAIGVKHPLSRGTLSLDARASRTAGSKRYRLDARARADFGKLGAVGLIAHQLQLPTEPPTRQLAALEGELSLHGDVELEELSPLLLELGVPIERTTGHVKFDVSASHAAKEDGLVLAARVATVGLRVIQRRTSTGSVTTGSEARQSKPIALEGIDLALAVRTWPGSGRFLTTLILRDDGGTLAEVQGEAELARAWASGFANQDALLEAPLRLALQVPRRRLRALPPLIRPTSLRGRVELDAGLEGSLLLPRARARLAVASMRATGSREPLDAAVELGYAPEGGEARVSARLTRGLGLAPVATANLAWTGDLRRIGEASASGSPLTADAQVQLDDFPLGVVPLLVDRQLGGQVSGELKLKDWGRDARLEARFDSTSLTFGTVPIDRFTAAAQVDEHKGSAEVALGVGAGSAKATVDTDLLWGPRSLPDLQRRANLKLAANAFRLDALSPMVKQYVSELGGVLDASAEVAVTERATQVTGSARLEKGVVQLPSIGQRFSDMTARVSVANDQIKLDRLDARGSTGGLSATGNARLDGFALQQADLKVEIEKRASLPITVEGAAIGEAWGNINASYRAPAQGQGTLDVDVPKFHLITPDAGGQSLQSLDRSEAIRVGARRADGKFVSLPLRPLEPESDDEPAPGEPAQPLRINVTLGRNVTVDRGRTAHFELTGKLTALVAEETQIDGRIELKGGKLDVSGKTFDIERGVVTFDGRDPANPTITATARWDGPEYTVYADYLGDVEDGRIKLRAEPPLTQDEILSLLLFGSPDGTAGGGGSNAALAISVAGGAATQGLNKVIDDFTNLDVSARVDTTTGSARPELVFQISPRVSAKITRAVGTPAVGESPDRTFLTLELHLKRSWALSAVFGDRGASALDLIWRKRY